MRSPVSGTPETQFGGEHRKRFRLPQLHRLACVPDRVWPAPSARPADDRRALACV